MKNYWMQLYEKKKTKVWTAEFEKNGLYVLRPRRVSVIDASYVFNNWALSSKEISIVFKDAMFSTNDRELMSFLSGAHHNRLSGMVSTIRRYQSLNEIENYELTGLSYNSLSTGIAVDDIKFTFGYKNMTHHNA